MDSRILPFTASSKGNTSLHYESCKRKTYVVISHTGSRGFHREDEPCERATSYVEARDGTSIVPAVITFMDALLTVINHRISPGFWGARWIAFFRGFGFMMHGAGIFTNGNLSSPGSG